MPRYDFKCVKCDAIYEVKRTMADRNRPPKSCTTCRGRKLVRLWAPIEFRVDK